uniref:Uncharacterized protein n=1 Tax=Ditylenchus dipsaci TaxID=166011 RepID=A0A915CMG8_9BILA
MDNWMDDDEPQPDCFLSTVGAVSHSDCSNDGSNGVTQAMNEAPAVLSESNASCSFSRIEAETGSGAIPEDTLANFEANDFTSTIDSTSHDYLLSTDFYGAGSSSFCNNTSNSSERKYAPSSSVNNSPAVSEIIQEMQSTNIGEVASTVERSLRVLRQLKNSTTRGQPTPTNSSTSKTAATSTASKMSKVKENQEDSSAIHKSGSADLLPTLLRYMNQCHVALTLEDLNSVFIRDKKIQSMSTLRKDRESRQKKRKETSKGGDEHKSKKSEHRRSSGSSKVFSKDRASTSPVAAASRASGSFGASVGKSAGLKKPKKFTPMATCCVCKETIDSDQTTLPSNTSFCSKECVQKQVKIAMQCVKPGESVMLMDLNGMVLNESKSPKIEALESFLMQYPNFQPVLNTSMCMA